LNETGFAIVGAASHHWEFISTAVRATKGTRMVGVYDEDKIRARRVARKLGVKNFDDLDELLADPNVNIGIVTAENTRKKRFAVSLARANKHIICDKPLGITAKETREVLAECKKSKVTLQVSYVSRYSSEAQFTKRFLSQGRVGSIKFINAENRVDMGLVKKLSPWLLQKKLGIGALLEHSVHALDLALWFNEGSSPSSVYALSANNLDQSCEGEDNFAILVEFDNGSVATADGSFCKPSSGRSGDILMKIFGEKAETDLYLSTLELREYLGEEPNVRVKVHSRLLDSSGGESAKLMVKDVLDCIDSGKEPLANGITAEEVNRVVDASYKSLASGNKELIER
jgi:predicted dehydrogenase